MQQGGPPPGLAAAQPFTQQTAGCATRQEPSLARDPSEPGPDFFNLAEHVQG